MDNLQGGTLALDHQYHLHQRRGSVGLVTAYTGSQDPFELPIEISVFDGLADAGADPSITDEVEKAARRAATLQHPGIARVVDFGEVDLGIPFVIEKIEPGRPLSDLLETRGVLAPDDVLKLVERLADLLDAAHQRDIFHGNLKPKWIDIDGDDLGSARLRHTGLALSMAQLVAMPNLVLTTELVDAFPPESFDVAARDDDAPDLRGDANSSVAPHLSAAADQWGLASLAYRLLVGVHPFFDDPVDPGDGIIRIKTDAPPSLDDLGIDSELAEVIGRGLDPDPQHRWPSITAFADAFARALGHGDDPLDTDPATDDPTPQAVVPLPDSAPPDDPPPIDPKPSGLLLTIAIGLVLLSNIAWFFVSLDADRPDDEPHDSSTAATDDDAGPPSQGILPTGLEIASSPSDVEVFIDDNGTERSLGYTPYTISDLLQEHHSLELFLRRDGYHEQTLRIDDIDGQRDRFEIDMIAEPGNTP